MRMRAVCQRHAQRGDCGQTRGDAVDDLDLHARSPQVLDLFAAPPEDERVAALEAHHVFAFIGGHDHEFFDEGLRCGFAAAALANVDDARAGSCVGSHDFIVDQIVHQQHRGGLDGPDGFDRQQLGVTRACTDQSALARARSRAFVRAHQVAPGLRCLSAVSASNGRYSYVFHSCFDRCKMCSTCRAIDGGTGLVPAMT